MGWLGRGIWLFSQRNGGGGGVCECWLPNHGFELGYCVMDMAVEGLLTTVHGEDRPEGHCCFNISGCKSLVHHEKLVHAELPNGVIFGAKGVNLLRHLLQLLAVAVGLSLVEVKAFSQVLGYSPSC